MKRYELLRIDQELNQIYLSHSPTGSQPWRGRTACASQWPWEWCQQETHLLVKPSTLVRFRGKDQTNNDPLVLQVASWALHKQLCHHPHPPPPPQPPPPSKKKWKRQQEEPKQLRVMAFQSHRKLLVCVCIPEVKAKRNLLTGRWKFRAPNPRSRLILWNIQTGNWKHTQVPFEMRHYSKRPWSKWRQMDRARETQSKHRSDSTLLLKRGWLWRSSHHSKEKIILYIVILPFWMPNRV